ncbi:MAG: DUF4043 family protein, partial [Proteobacteria bacterium]|nr:DUF4043 family protein [Pseudomonadota bacterium]
MGNTTFTTGDALTRKAWAKDCWVEARPKIFWNKFMGSGEDYIIEEKNELKTEKGDKITFGLLMNLSGAGVTGDSAMEGSEEALTFYDDSVTIDQIRNAVRLDGAVTEQRAA